MGQGDDFWGGGDYWGGAGGLLHGGWQHGRGRERRGQAGAEGGRGPGAGGLAARGGLAEVWKAWKGTRVADLGPCFDTLSIPPPTLTHPPTPTPTRCYDAVMMRIKSARSRQRTRRESSVT